MKRSICTRIAVVVFASIFALGLVPGAQGQANQGNSKGRGPAGGWEVTVTIPTGQAKVLILLTGGWRCAQVGSERPPLDLAGEPILWVLGARARRARNRDHLSELPVRLQRPHRHIKDPGEGHVERGHGSVHGILHNAAPGPRGGMS